jgi:hypothetical protein
VSQINDGEHDAELWSDENLPGIERLPRIRLYRRLMCEEWLMER